MKWIRRSAAGLVYGAGVVLMSACGDSPTGPKLPLDAVAGTYDLSTFTFDPQGSLEAKDIRSRFTGDETPELNLTRTGTAQLVFRRPSDGFFDTVNGKFTTGDSTVTITWDDGSDFDFFLLSKRMTYRFSPSGSGGAQLSFSGASPDGVSRARLIGLVPEWQDEQLFDPVPGVLTIVFTLAAP